jgi:hypothetical protein
MGDGSFTILIELGDLVILKLDKGRIYSTGFGIIDEEASGAQ